MIAIAGGKGGTGKTTTAVGLARSLAGRRRRPILVDADVEMPDLAVSTGVPPTPGLAALAEGVPFDRVVHALPGVPGVGVVPAEPGDALSGALAALPENRPVVLDCPAGAAMDATLPLRAADRAVLVTTSDRQAVEDTLKTAAMARALGTDLAAVVVSRAPRVPDGLLERVGVDEGIAVPAAPGVPLSDGDVSAAYDRLAAVCD